MFMKLTAFTLKLAIIFQLILGNTPLTSYTAKASNCGTGLEWNSFLGRCLTTPEAAAVKDASLRCMAMSTRDAQVGCFNNAIADRVVNAENDGLIDEYVGVKGKGIQNAYVQTALALAGIASSWLFLTTAKGDCPGATSAWLIAGAGVAAITGEIWSALQYKSLMKKQEDLVKRMSRSSAGNNSDNATPTDIQSEVFTAMIAKEDATIKAGKTKKNLYVVATAAYAAATVLAIFEAARMAKGDVSVNCQKALLMTRANNPSSRKLIVENYINHYFEKNQRVPYTFYITQNSLNNSSDLNSFIAINKELDQLRDGAMTSLSLEDYALIKNTSSGLSWVDEKNVFDELKKIAIAVKNNMLISQALAQRPPVEAVQKIIPKGVVTTPLEIKATLITPQNVQFTEVKKALTTGQKLKKFFLNPYTRLAFAAILTTNAAFMIKNANKQISIAEERKIFLDDLRTQVLAENANFGQCTEAQRNDTQMPTCYCFNSSGVNPARSNSEICKTYFGQTPKSGGTTADGSNPKTGCVSSNGTISITGCPCKATNSCASVKTPSKVGGYPGGQILGDIPGTVNALNGGSISPMSIDPQKMLLGAARLNAMAKKILADPKNKKIASETKKNEALAQKLNSQIASQHGGMGPSGGGSSGGGLSNLLGSTPQEAIEKLKEELKKEVEYEAAQTASTNPSSSGSDDFSLDGMDNTGITIEDDSQVAEVMNSNFNYGDNDINSNSGEDIFKILSNRYQRSGMRRLFGGEALVPADQAAESEISN
jgi:hypothetical protein